MHRLSLVLGLLLALSAVFHAAPASAHSGYWRVADTAGNGLRLRTGPSGNYRIIEVMARGDRLLAFGHRGNWIKVRHLATGSVGWASLTYVVADSGSSGSGGSTSGLQLCFPNTWGQTFCAAQWIADTAYAAARYWGASYWWLMSIASCESNFDPSAYAPSTGVSGIMQFLPSTMEWISPGSNPWSVSDSMYVAAHMYVMGLAYHWDCNWRI